MTDTTATTTKQLNFFDTIGLNPQDLDKENKKAKGQEDRILSVMRVSELMTPPEVLSVYNARFNAVPLTSIRRAMTNLTSKGYLMKTAEQGAGQYGKPNYKWKRII